MKRKFYLTSDTHFGHGNIMKYCRRDKWLTNKEIEILNSNNEKEQNELKICSESVHNMNKGLLDGINNTVDVDDVLFFLGDFSFRHIHKYLRFIQCQNIVFVKGNHDDQEYDTLHPLQQGLISANVNTGEYTICRSRRGNGWIQFVINHYLMAIWESSHKGAYHFYGHSHSNAEWWADKAMPYRKSMDVGVDNAFKLLGEYRPFELQEAISIINNREPSGRDDSQNHHLSVRGYG